MSPIVKTRSNEFSFQNHPCDTPLYSVAAQCVRILEADLIPHQKRAILGGNTCRFFRLSST